MSLAIITNKTESAFHSIVKSLEIPYDLIPAEDITPNLCETYTCLAVLADNYPTITTQRENIISIIDEFQKQNKPIFCEYFPIPGIISEKTISKPFLRLILKAEDPIDKYAVLDYKLWMLFFCGISFSGVIFSGFLHLNNMVKGQFSEILWIAGFLLFIIAGIILGFTTKADLYSPDLWFIGFILLGIITFLLLLGKVFNKIKRKSADYSVNQELDEIDKKEKKTNILSPRNWLDFKKVPLKAIFLLVIIGCGLIITPTIAVIANSTAQREQVLGTYNGEYYLWYADSLRTIDENYRPNLAQSSINSTVSVAAARGEHEGFQVILTPGDLKALNIWSFTPESDLINTVTGDHIGSGNISIYSEQYVDQLADQYPDQLIPFQRLNTPWTITEQQNYPFYIDVSVPLNDSIDAGTYTTTLLFHCYDYNDIAPEFSNSYTSRDVSFTLQLIVFNFSISLQRHIGTEIIWGIPDNTQWVQFYNAYRLDANWPDSCVINYTTTPQPLSITFNWTKFDADVEYGFSLGMDNFPISWQPAGIDWTNLNYTPAYQTLVEWYIANLTTNLSTITTPWNTSALDSAYYFVIDEPGPSEYNLITNISTFIHAVCPQLRIMETMDQDLSTYPDSFLDQVDIYCQHIHDWVPSSAYPDPTNGQLNGWPLRLRDFVANYTGPRQKALWVYNTHNQYPFPDTDIYMPGIEQRNSFWLYWVYGITGWLYWSFNWGTDRSGGYGYAAYGESTLVGYGHDDSPLSSLRLERVLGGIEDYEYFWLLNTTDTQLKAQGLSSQAEQGFDLLHQIDLLFDHPETFAAYQNNDLKSYQDAYCWDYEPSSQPYMNLRNAVGLELTRLASLGLLSNN